MPRKKTENNWQVTNVNNTRDRKRIGRSSDAHRAQKREQKERAQRRRIRTNTNGGGCAVVALGGMAAIGLSIARWRGWL